MIDQPTAIRIIKETLAGQANFSELRNDRLRLEAISGALAAEAQSEPHARAMMREWSRISVFVPTPCDIEDMAARIGDPAAPVIPAGCEACANQPWVAVERNGYSGVDRCTCPRGQYLRQRDKERATQEPESAMPAVPSVVRGMRTKEMPR